MITTPSGRKLGRGLICFFVDVGDADKGALVLNLRNVRSQPKADMTNLHMGGGRTFSMVANQSGRGN